MKRILTFTYYRIPALILLFSLLCLSCARQEIITTPWDMLKNNPETQLRLRVEPEDCLPRRPYPDKKGFEMWYADVLCSDGRVIMLYFKYGRIYRGLSSRAQVVLHIFEQGKPYIIKESDYFDFSLSEFGCDITIGSNSIRCRDPDYRINVQIDDVRLQLRLTSLIRGYKLSDNRVLFGSCPNPDYNEWIIIVPRARAEGSLSIGSDTIQVSGDAYLDHWLGNIPINTIFTRCHWGKIYHDRYSLIFQWAMSEKKFSSRKLGFCMLFDNDLLIAATDLIDIDTITQEYSAVTGRMYPTRFTLKIDDESVKGRVSCSPNRVLAAINHVKYQLGSFGWLYPLVKPIFGTPYSYGMIAEARVKLDVNGNKIVFDGPMFHEIDNKR